MIIGITGTNASGKDTAANFFTDRDFDSFSLSDIIREEAKKRNLESTRDNLRNLGKELREKFGPSYLSEQTLKKIKKNSIVTSIRHPKEVTVLKEAKGFFLIAVDAPIKLRYERAKKRERGEQDAKSFESFKKQEKYEFNKKGSGQQLGVCMEMADYKIENSETKEKFYQKLEELFNQIK
ncbi:unnamed protein product, partial [marine sediment metagenome]